MIYNRDEQDKTLESYIVREARREAVRLRLEGVEEDVKAARDEGLFPVGFKRRIADAIDGMELLKELLRRAEYVPDVEAMEIKA